MSSRRPDPSPRRRPSSSGRGSGGSGRGGGGKGRGAGRRTGSRRAWVRTLVLTGLAMGVVFLAGMVVAVAATDVPKPNDIATAQATVVYWAEGGEELARLGEANRTSVVLDDIPAHTRKAVVAAEDRGFYEHGGFSPVGIARALLNNLTSGSTQGASTITQQYAKNAFLTQERTVTRKIRELVLSVKLETQTDKDQILEDYLNTIYFGRSTYGIETAAQAYFGIPAHDLTVSQSAVLAAIIRSPGAYTPEKDMKRLKDRWTYVLDGMVEAGWLTQADREQQEFPEIRERSRAQRFAGPKGHLIDTVRRELIRAGFTEPEIDLGGLRVVSTFERQAFDALVKAVEEQGPTSGTEGLRIGVASVRPGTGEVVALYGGADYLEDQLNNATQAIGQAGSTFKPFALAAGLENGVRLDSRWNGNSGIKVRDYKVNNYGNRSWGEVSLLKATEMSINSPYVAMSTQVGNDKVVDMAIRAGIPENTPGLEPVLSVALGTSSPRVIDIASAYSTFAARGMAVDPVFIKEVRGRNGGVLFQMRAEPRRAVPERVADTVNYALQQVIRVGTGRSASIGRPAAGKTGTTNENRSAWFAGYTPELATAVMMVKDGEDGQPVSLRGTGGLATVTGGSFPAAIFAAYMRGALEGVEPTAFAKPAPEELPTATVTPSETLEPSESPSETGSPSPTESSPSPTDGTQSPSESVSMGTTALAPGRSDTPGGGGAGGGPGSDTGGGTVSDPATQDLQGQGRGRGGDSPPGQARG